MEVREESNKVIISENSAILRISKNRFDEDLGYTLDCLRDKIVEIKEEESEDILADSIDGVELEIERHKLDDSQEALYLVDSLVDKAESVFHEYN